jgi:hypothetical protein
MFKFTFIPHAILVHEEAKSVWERFEPSARNRFTGAARVSPVRIRSAEGAESST